MLRLPALLGGFILFWVWKSEGAVDSNTVHKSRQGDGTEFRGIDNSGWLDVEQKGEAAATAPEVLKWKFMALLTVRC